jgi:putative ABC transport system permease protein
METLLQDLRYGFRMLRNSPGFTAVVVLTLALGVGANTAIFSVVNTVLLQPLSFPEPDRLVSVSESKPSAGTERFSVSPPNFSDWRDQNRVFSGIAAYDPNPMALTGRGEAQRIVALSASPSLLATLRVQPFLGRGFLEEEGQQGHDHEVILSHQLWQSSFGGDVNIVGQSTRLDGEKYAIVGVMPAGFRFPLSGADVWLPLSFQGNVSSQRGAHYLETIARLKPGTTVEQARQELKTIGERLALEYPKTNKGSNVSVSEFRDSLVGEVRPALLILLAAVGLVVLIACTNITNLLLARANERVHEVAIRTALGGSPHRLVRQFLTESLLMASLGGLSGLIIAVWGIRAIVKFGPRDIPMLEAIRADGSVLAFTFGLTLLTGLIFGLVPALKAAKADLNDSLKTGLRSVGPGERGWLRGALVTGELALSLVLLTGAGLLVRSFLRVTGVDPGFDPSHLLIFDLSLSEAAYPDGARVAQFSDSLLAHLKGLPQVGAASTVFPRPLSGEPFTSSFSIKGAPPAPEGEERSVQMRVVGLDYFGTMRIPVIKGRSFERSDRRESQHVLLLSQQGARNFFPHGDAIGQEMTLHARAGSDKIGGQIVGIVGDVHYSGLDIKSQPDVYALLEQAAVSEMSVVVRTSGDPAVLASAVHGQVHAVDQNLPLSDLSTMNDLMAASLGQRRFYMLLLGLFATVALALAAVGVYGVMAYSVSRRTWEIGVRLALGAPRERVLAMVLSESVRLVLIGLTVGVAVTAGASRLLSRLLFGITAGDPLTFLGSVVALSIIALLASFLPARRASNVDPMVALRYE